MRNIGVLAFVAVLALSAFAQDEDLWLKKKHSAAAAAAGGTNCSSCAVNTSNSTDSGNGPSVSNDPTSYPNPTVAGHTLWVVFTHDHWASGATATITGSCSTAGGAEVETWHNAATGATSTSFTDVQFASTWGLEAWYALNITGCAGVYTVTVQPSVCSSNCNVGGTYMDITGPHAFDVGSTLANGTTSGSSNRGPCGAATPTQNNDFWIGGLNNTSGTFSAGTSPISFSLYSGTANEWVESAVYSGWSSGSVTPTYNASATGLAYGCIMTAFR